MDAAEVGEQIPSRLLNKLAQWRHQGLSTIFFLYHPEDATSRHTYITLRKILHYRPPIDVDTVELATTIIGIVRNHLSEWDGSKGAPPTRWRIKARLCIDESTEAFRYCDFNASEDDFWDAEDETDPVRQQKIATDALETACDLVIKAISALVKSGENFSKMGEAVCNVANGAATLSANAGAGLAQVMEVQRQMEKDRLRFEAEARSSEAWADMFGKFVVPMMPQIMSVLADAMKAKGSATKEDSAGRAPSRSDKLRTLIDSVGPQRWEALIGLMTAPELDIIETMTRPLSDFHFLRLFGQLRAAWEPRWETLIQQIQDVLGPHAAEFGLWAMECAAAEAKT